jgi:hypothetical protein
MNVIGRFHNSRRALVANQRLRVDVPGSGEVVEVVEVEGAVL